MNKAWNYKISSCFSFILFSHFVIVNVCIIFLLLAVIVALKYFIILYLTVGDPAECIINVFHLLRFFSRYLLNLPFSPLLTESPCYCLNVLGACNLGWIAFIALKKYIRSEFGVEHELLFFTLNRYVFRIRRIWHFLAWAVYYNHFINLN